MYSTTTTSRFSCLLLLALASCAEGGDEDRPKSEIPINAQHHMFGLRTLRGFGTFPVNPSVVVPDRGLLNLFDNSTYTITRQSSTSTADRYAIESTGELAIFVTGSGSEPSVVFRGGYGVTASASEYFFTDRVTTTASPSVGLYYGTRRVAGQVELEGAWHVMSLHTIFGQAILTPENVARGTFGAVTITAGTPGTLRTISGTGTQGTATQGTSGVVLGGQIQNVLDGAGSGDGTCNLSVSYQVGAQPVDSRTMQSAATANLVLALDEDETDDEAGTLFMVRKFDTATPVDGGLVVGRYLVGGHTVFTNPSNCGSDAFVGVVTLGVGNSFRLDATGANGADFTYSGNYTLAQDGVLTISINGTNETWHAAIDRGYRTLVFLDDFFEVRANNNPELNIGFGVREKTN